MKYLFNKAFAISTTIILGVLVTIIIANQKGQIEASIEQEIVSSQAGWNWSYIMATTEERKEMDKLMLELKKEAGLQLPYWPRQLWWTVKALKLDWQGYVDVSAAPGSSYPSHKVRDIILTDLPHTLLLVGSSYLLLYVLGIPLALYLFRNQGKWVDRLVTLFALISSVPSWVLCVFLILIFSVNLRVLPTGGMFDTLPDATTWEKFLTVLRHGILPVSAILLSLLFQLVSSWRTYLLIFADEDYVTLAKAKGLTDKTIERQYILRPTSPYILTSFAMLLVSFWQMTIALEKVINWPGIGRLYILTLPNFHGESFYPGIISVTMSIVVLFAYILGATVFILDLLYGLLDPRIRIGDDNQTVSAVLPRGEKRINPGWWKTLFRREKSRSDSASTVLHVERRIVPKIKFADILSSIGQGLVSIKRVFREVAHYPSAVFGLTIILLLIIGSLYAVIAFPYSQLNTLWQSQAPKGKIYVPKLAKPAWVNWFKRGANQALPPTLIMDDLSSGTLKAVSVNSSGGENVTLTYTIEYPYSDFPQELTVYFDTVFKEKFPFAALTWITPDGRTLDLGGMAAGPEAHFDANVNVPVRRLLRQNPGFETWFEEYGFYPTSAVYLLFADPESDEPVVLPGTYTLQVNAFTFENASTIDSELVILGQVYGAAGTDFLRRDLLVPLLWGMPFALIIGLLGAFVTTILSMILAAIGVWYGGWVDAFVQKMIETNMILPIIAISVMIYSYFNISIWGLLGIVVLLNVFGSPTKSFRAALLQVKEAPYVEAARAYGASDSRIIFQYLIPRIISVLIPQLVAMIPSYVFLEATLGIFNVKSIYPTWGRVIYDALRYGASYGSSFWVLQPLTMLLLTGLAFSLLGFALEQILNPRLKTG